MERSVGPRSWASLPSVDTVNTVRATSDGGCIVLGKTEPPDLDFRDFPFAARFDSVRELLWFRTYAKKQGSEEYQSVEALPDGGFLVGGRSNKNGDYMLALRLDSGGNVMWKKGVPCSGGANGAAVAALADGRLGVAGYTVNRFGKQDPHLALLDASGRLLWARLYAIGDTASFTGVMPGPDGGLMVTGIGMGIGGNGAMLRFLLRVDASGSRSASSTPAVREFRAEARGRRKPRWRGRPERLRHREVGR